MSLLVGALIEGRRSPITVRADTALPAALEQMIEHAYSQLPVVRDDGSVEGIITSDSILRAISNFGLGLKDLRVMDALERVRPYRADEELFDLLDALRDNAALIIIDKSDKLCGIVTDFDVMEHLRQRIQNIMLTDDIESKVKENILASFVSKDGQIDFENLRTAIEDITPSNKKQKGKFAKAIIRYMDLEETPLVINGTHLQGAFDACLFERASPKEFEQLSLDEYRQLFLYESRWPFYQQAMNVD
ncbi:MAG: CBS domain-containing protein, partial [Chloroflexota bacterium]